MTEAEGGDYIVPEGTPVPEVMGTCWEFGLPQITKLTDYQMKTKEISYLDLNLTYSFFSPYYEIDITINRVDIGTNYLDSIHVYRGSSVSRLNRVRRLFDLLEKKLGRTREITI